MRPLTSLLKAMALSSSGVRDLVAENPRLFSATVFLAGVLAWVIATVSFFAPFAVLIRIVALVLFLAFVYVPAAVVVCNLFAGDGLSFQISRREYDSNFVSLASLLGAFLMIGAVLAWLAPIVGTVALAAGYLVYVPLALKEANSLPWGSAAAAGVVLLATLPLAFLGMTFLFALPFFILVVLAFLGWVRLRVLLGEQRQRRGFEERLQRNLINPHDADACYQLGWLYLNKRRFRSAEEFFQKAVALQPSDIDYHYGLARARMEQQRWMEAFESLEQVYQSDQRYQTGDVLRDLGQAYFHLGYLEQAEQFLRAFLDQRPSDAEGKYWLARVLGGKGEAEEAAAWLARLADRVQTPGGFRKMETRHWKRLGRDLAATIRE